FESLLEQRCFLDVPRAFLGGSIAAVEAEVKSRMRDRAEVVARAVVPDVVVDVVGMAVSDGDFEGRPDATPRLLCDDFRHAPIRITPRQQRFQKPRARA